MTGSRFGHGSANNATRAVIGGTYSSSGAAHNNIEYITMGTSGSGTNFGNLTMDSAYTGAGAVAFPPPAGVESAATGYLEPGPANEGATGRWKSPYIRNCTNFMTGSIGMKINGDHADANFTGTNNLGQDIKSMVCDSFESCQ